jgi:hypothetical protein
MFICDRSADSFALVKNPTPPHHAALYRAANRDWHASCKTADDHFGPKEMDLVP